MSERNCPFCQGTGNCSHQDFAGPEGLRTWQCLNCNGTGDYETMKLMRACRLGEYNGEARAIAQVSSAHPGARIVKELEWDTIASAVIDDVRRQRHEEMLDPSSRQFKRIEAEVERLLREREPMLAAAAALAAEVQEELASYA